MKKKKVFVSALLLALLMICAFPMSVAAAEQPIKKEYVGIRSYYSDTVQYKVYKYTYAKRWTPTKVLKGQNPGGYYLKKGDAMFYLDNNKGISASVSFAGLSVSVPLGQYSKKSVGIVKTANQKGYYVLQCKREVYPIVYYGVEKRTRGSNLFSWGSWKKCNKVLRTDKIIYRSHPSLKKVG